MVSARPAPKVIGGRTAYPSAQTYTPGDVGEQPETTSPTSPSKPAVPTFQPGSPSKGMTGGGGIERVMSNESDKAGLMTWFKGFRDRSSSEPQRMDTRCVFGVPLSESIEYASVQISTAGPDGALYVWGVIPVVVAKCGLYLKEHGTEVEGAFRISGSAKRMRELQTLFDTGPKFGKNLDWKTLTFTTHDVATIFRRFLTQAPESIVPNDFYHDFREVDRDDKESAVKEYKALIRAMPPVNQYLLLYVLDLLSVFARKSDVNLMTAPNLALIFQPGVLSHPNHAMRPKEHVLSQQVLEFLIEHQDNFLIGMQLKPKRRKRKDRTTAAASIRSGTTGAGAASIRSGTTGAVSPDPSFRTAIGEPQAERIPTPEPPKPPGIKADPDYMLASDSDDDAPDGGYYIVEGNHPEPADPNDATLPPPQPARTTSRSPLPVEPSLIRPKYVRPPKKVPEDMELSSSDDEPPVGGYQVKQGTWESNRDRLLGKGPGQHGGAVAGVGVSRRNSMPTSTKKVEKFKVVQNPPLKSTNKEAP